jgi:hypothetical protein
MIGAGAVVTNDVPAYAIVKGNPARITGYIRDKEIASPISTSNAASSAVIVAGAELVQLGKASDMRGDLVVAEFASQVPFQVKRMFFVTNVPSHHVRGSHAHRHCHQLLVCLQGSVTVEVDNGTVRGEWVLEHPEQGLHIHPMVWATQYKYSPNAVLAVFASHKYDAGDYIRDYEAYISEIGEGNAQ